MVYDTDFFDTSRFDPVWDRVTGADTASAAVSNNLNSPCAVSIGNTAAADAAALRCIMDMEAVTYRECCCLARRCGGEFGRMCEAIACSSRQTIREMDVQYFIITGRSYSPASAIDPGLSAADALRRVCLVESDITRKLDDLANTTDSPSLARACLCAAKDAKRRACAAERLLASCGCL